MLAQFYVNERNLKAAAGALGAIEALRYRPAMV